MNRLIYQLSVAAMSLLVAGAAFAHHAVNAQFDNRQYIEMDGVLTNSELINPHSYFTFDVTDEDGTVTSWEFESAAAAVVMRAGIPARELFQKGKVYHIFAHPARDGSSKGLLTTMVLPDGRTVGFGSERSLRGDKANDRVDSVDGQ